MPSWSQQNMGAAISQPSRQQRAANTARNAKGGTPMSGPTAAPSQSPTTGGSSKGGTPMSGPTATSGGPSTAKGGPAPSGPVSGQNAARMFASTGMMLGQSPQSGGPAPSSPLGGGLTNPAAAPQMDKRQPSMGASSTGSVGGAAIGNAAPAISGFSMTANQGPTGGNVMPSWMNQPTPGTAEQLGNAERYQSMAPWAGRIAGALTGIPGASSLGSRLGTWAGNRNMNNLANSHYFHSPGGSNSVMGEMMSNIDPNYGVRQNSSQGYVGQSGSGQGMGTPGGNMGFRGGIGGRGAGLGGGWRTIYQRPDDSE